MYKNHNIIIAIDHDGTASKYDIGREFLSSLFPNVYKIFGAKGAPSEKFTYVVKELRSGKWNDYIEKTLGIKYDPEKDHGIELALMVLLESKYDGLNRKKIEDIVKEAVRENNVLKYGVEDFLKNPIYPTWISTAGIETFIKEIYEHYGINGDDNNHYVVGTRLYYDEKGKPSGIKRKNGRYQKPENLKKDLEIEKNGIQIIAVGDSSGDMKLLELASGKGLAISSGEGARKYSNIVVLPVNGSFEGEVAAIIAAEQILKGGSGEDALKALEEYFVDKKPDAKIELGDVKNPHTETVFNVLKKFLPKNYEKKIFW